MSGAAPPGTARPVGTARPLGTAHPGRTRASRPQARCPRQPASCSEVVFMLIAVVAALQRLVGTPLFAVSDRYGRAAG